MTKGGLNVSNRMVEFRANGRTASGYLSLPQQPGPGIVVVQEWWGLVGHIKDLADRFAAEGFVALAPDLYNGEVTKSPDDAGKMLMALNIGEAAKDMKGAAEYLLDLDEVNPKKVGILGFCMGGQLALYAATEFPQQFSASVDFYGIHPNAQIDPSKLQVPVQAHFGKRDHTVPEESARALVESIEASGKSIEAHFYDADHAFFNDTRPEVHNREAAALAWTRTLAFLRQHLK
jgi:carboxymethylenebutenolidase